MLFKPQQMIGA